MKNKKVASLLLICLMALSLCAGCFPTAKTTPTATASTPLQQITDRVSSLETQVQSVKKSVQDLAATEGTDFTDDIATLQDSIDTLQADLVALTAKVDALTSNGSTDGATGDIVKWEYDGWVDTTDYDDLDLLEITVTSSPRVVEEEDTYKFYISVSYNSSEPIKLDDIVIELTPKDSTNVISKDIEFSSVRTPSLDWSTTVKTNKDGTCRKISAMAESTSSGKGIVLPANSGSDSGDYTFTVEFDLSYA